MMKFLRATHILLSKKLLQSPAHIKLDLTVDERKTESLLLKKRRVPINKSVTGNRIKLRKSQLLVDNQPHCLVQNSLLQFIAHPHKDGSDAPMTIEHSTTSDSN